MCNSISRPPLENIGGTFDHISEQHRWPRHAVCGPKKSYFLHCKKYGGKYEITKLASHLYNCLKFVFQAARKFPRVTLPVLYLPSSNPCINSHEDILKHI